MEWPDALRDYPARAWHAGAHMYLCLPCCDLFGHLLEGGNEMLVPLEPDAPARPCNIHLDPARAPCSFDQAVEIPNPDGDVEGVMEDAPVGDEPGALRTPRADVLERGGSEDIVSKSNAKPEAAKPEAAKPEASEPEAPAPRWEMIIRPAPNSEAQIEIRVHAQDVTLGEVTHLWAKVGPSLTRGSSHQRLPTEAEVVAQQEANQRAKDHPATRLWVKDGRQVWLGDEARAAGVFGEMTTAGWVDAGPVPDGVRKACEFALDAVAFRAKWLRPGDTGKAASEPPEA